MKRLVLLVWCFLLLAGWACESWAASAKALSLRQTNGLEQFTPPEKFLASNFVADEMNPNVIFGPVQDFARSRKCPTTWLKEAGDNNPQDGTETLAEYTLYLEEDCPDKVVYYVFIDQSGLTPQQWIDWREKFHKSKAGEEFATTKTKLEQACTTGCGVGAELRFIENNGELVTKPPEEILRSDLNVAPIYDLNRQQKITK